MRTRLLAGLAVIAIAVVAVVTLRFFSNNEATPVISSASAPPSAPASGATTTPEPSPSPGPATSATSLAAAASAAPSATSLVTPTPTPSPLPTENPNLLRLSNGAFVARWTVHSSAAGDPQVLTDGQAWIIDPAFAGAPQVLFELPARATIDSLQIDVETPDSQTDRVGVAIGDRADDLHDSGTLTLPVATDTHRSATLGPKAAGRFVRLTFSRTRGVRFVVDDVIATGTEDPLPPARFDGYWTRSHLADDEIFAKVLGLVPDSVPKSAYDVPFETASYGSYATVSMCVGENEEFGQLDGSRATLIRGERLFVVRGGNVLVGYYDGHPLLAVRIPTSALCVKPPIGKGPTVAIVTRSGSEPTKFDQFAALPTMPYRNVLTSLTQFNPRTLSGSHTAQLIDICNADSEIAPWQAKALLDWVSAGGVLIVRDSDACGASSYAFMPYPYKTFPVGARGIRGFFLRIADPSQLGAGADDPAHFVDTKAYVAHHQDLGDADVIQTNDPHWCGHMLTKNGVGAVGWVHAYARYGHGLLIFNGFDADDLNSYDEPNAIAITRLEYAVSPRNDLPCNAHVADRLALWPSTSLRVPAGRATALRVPMSVAHVEGGSSRTTLAIAAAADRWPARVEPSAIMLGAQESHLTAVISVPARVQGDFHTFTVTATDASGATARATITIETSTSLAKQLEHSRRARIYGIHFDVDSATIQARSEPVIAQIADVLRQNPNWRMRVEGYTDSDGGAAYNLGLSSRRAASVVADLATRYHIAHSRLVPVGFGLTHPVASNATEAGKALNRRVELVRL